MVIWLITLLLVIPSTPWAATPSTPQITETHYVGIITAKTHIRFDVVRPLGPGLASPTISLRLVIEESSGAGRTSIIMIDPEELSALRGAIPRIAAAARKQMERHPTGVASEITHVGPGYQFGAVIGSEGGGEPTWFIRGGEPHDFLTIIPQNWFDDFLRQLEASEKKIIQLKMMK